MSPLCVCRGPARRSYNLRSVLLASQGFRTFCVTLWNFCTLSDAQLRVFAFALYDDDGDGSLDLKNLKDILTYVYGQSSAKKQLERLYEYRMQDDHSFPVLMPSQFDEFIDKCVHTQYGCSWHQRDVTCVAGFHK